jgi:hypothetical protein
VSQWPTTATSDVIDVPTGYSVLPKEVPRPSRRWAARRFVTIVNWKRAGPRRPLRRVGAAADISPRTCDCPRSQVLTVINQRHLHKDPLHPGAVN